MADIRLEKSAKPVGLPAVATMANVMSVSITMADEQKSQITVKKKNVTQ